MIDQDGIKSFIVRINYYLENINLFGKIKKGFNEYPGPFKVLTLATFIDMIGTFLLYPFFALYITSRFSVGLPEVGILFGIFSAGNLIGGFIGGGLADKFGRRFIILFGMVVSGVGSILMGLANDLFTFYLLAAALGLIGSLGGPARQAMVVDLLPSEKETEGFAVMRIAFNLSAVVGPILGGFLATQSYMLLFISDAASSLVTAVIVYFVIPETKPEIKEGESEKSVLETLSGYKEALKDGVFISFCLVSIFLSLVYLQMNSTLPVFLRDQYGFSEQWFGLLLAMNAAMVVLFQMGIANIISKYDPMKMMALGAICYMIGFGMYGFISEFYLFFVAMVIVTIGEMIVSPVSQKAVASLSPRDKRGRYMGLFGFTWAIPSIFGVYLAAVVSEIIGPNWIWYIAGIISFFVSIGFYLLRKVAAERFNRDEEAEVVEMKKVIE